MKRKTLLKKQTVKKRKKEKPSVAWKMISFSWGYATKFSLMLIVLALISGTFVALYEYLLTSPYIRLEKVVITGVGGDIKQELIQSSGLTTDMTLLAINLKKVRDRMEGHPWIRSVKLQKQFPHTLLVKAEKEKPCAVILLDKLYFMNRLGEIFKEVENHDAIDYPIVTGVSGKEDSRDDYLVLAASILDTLEAEREPFSMKELSEIHVGGGGVSLYFNSLPAVIQLGSIDLGTRMGDLKKVVEHLNDTGRIPMVKRINLNYQDGAVVSFKNG